MPFYPGLGKLTCGGGLQVSSRELCPALLFPWRCVNAESACLGLWSPGDCSAPWVPVLLPSGHGAAAAVLSSVTPPALPARCLAAVLPVNLKLRKDSHPVVPLPCSPGKQPPGFGCFTKANPSGGADALSRKGVRSVLMPVSDTHLLRLKPSASPVDPLRDAVAASSRKPLPLALSLGWAFGPEILWAYSPVGFKPCFGQQRCLSK